jgi:hypothetical protein
MRRLVPLIWIALATFTTEASLVTAFAVTHWSQVGPRFARYRFANDLRR